MDLERFPTNETAQRMLSRVSPVYERSYVGKWLFQVMGTEMEGARQYFEQLRLQAFPETATWGLEYWEKRYGMQPILDSISDAERRQKVILRRSFRAPMNPARVESIINSICGKEIRIEENTAPYQFTIFVLDSDETVSARIIKDTVQRIKPSHICFAMNERYKIIVFLHENIFLLNNFRVHIKIPNFGSVVLLNGRKTLDNSWNLNQVFSGMAFIRLSFLLAYKELNDFKVCFALGILSFQTTGKSDIYSIGVQTNFRNYEKAIYQKLAFRVCAKQENYLSAVRVQMGVFTCKTVENSQMQELMIQVPLKNQEHSALQRLEWNVQAKQKYGLSATLTKDSMWWLNSEAPLNGKRNLNPRIIKEDI